MSPLVSVIVLNYDKRQYTDKCLRSVVETTHRPLEVVLVDNGSTDGSVEMIPEWRQALEASGVDLKTHLNEENVGAPAGRNQGMKLAEGDYVAWMDNDVIVKDRDWVDQLRARLDADEDLGIVSPKLLFPPPDERIEFAGCAVTPRGRVVYVGRGRDKDDPEVNVERDTQCLISACVLLPRRAIEAAGEMDEAFFPVQYEDIDYCYRLKSLGFRCRIVPSVEMYHYEHITTDGSEDIKFLEVTTKNGLLFRRRWRHVFENEGGPPDDAYRWENLDRPRL
ncbi:MAG: glycosyltransferase [Armatimonadia bacterium]|nr:glycosyltransferase [Armatimonadia bacterium]